MRRLTISLLIFLLFLSGCSPKASEKKVGTHRYDLDRLNKIRIGVNWYEPAESSPFANGLYLALDEINQEGVHGKQFEIDYRCNDGNPDLGVKIANRFVKDRSISAVVGHYFSGIAERCVPIYIKNSMMMINIDAQLASLAFYNSYYIYRLSPTTAEIAKYYSFALRQLGYSNPLIINTNSAYAQDLSRRFINELDNLGLEPAKIVTLFEGFREDPNTLNDIMQTDFDALLFFTEPDLVLPMLKPLHTLGCQAPTLTSNETIELDNANPSEYGKIYLLNDFKVESTTPQMKAFTEKYRDRYGEDPAEFATVGYVALRLYADMVDSANSVLPDRIAVQLNILEDYPSAMGPIKFATNGDILTRNIRLHEVGKENDISWHYTQILTNRLHDRILSLLVHTYQEESVHVRHPVDSLITIDLSSSGFFLGGTNICSTRGKGILERVTDIIMEELSLCTFKTHADPKFWGRAFSQSLEDQAKLVNQYSSRRASNIVHIYYDYVELSDGSDNPLGDKEFGMRISLLFAGAKLTDEIPEEMVNCFPDQGTYTSTADSTQ